MTSLKALRMALMSVIVFLIMGFIITSLSNYTKNTIKIINERQTQYEQLFDKLK